MKFKVSADFMVLRNRHRSWCLKLMEKKKVLKRGEDEKKLTRSTHRCYFNALLLYSSIWCWCTVRDGGWDKLLSIKNQKKKQVWRRNEIFFIIREKLYEARALDTQFEVSLPLRIIKQKKILISPEISIGQDTGERMKDEMLEPVYWSYILSIFKDQFAFQLN